MIYTHTHVDLDAVMSVCAYCILHKIPLDSENITFVPASEANIPPGSIIIDLQQDKHVGPSHCDQYAEYFPREIMWEINQVDSGHVGHSILQLSITALRKAGKSDLQIIQTFEPIVYGFFQIRMDYDVAESQFEKIPIVDINGYKFLRLENMRTVGALGGIASRQGIVGTIYLENYNMGITRYNPFKLPDLSQLPYLEGWFKHNKGFLFAYGTRKSTSHKWNPHFNSLDAFITWLRKELV